MSREAATPLPPRLPTRTVAGLNLFLALLQLALFFPQLAGGHDLDFAALFRVNSLSVAFGVIWCLSLAYICLRLPHIAAVRYSPFVTAGLLIYAYSAGVELLIAGWSLAGLGVGLMLRVTSRRQARQHGLRALGATLVLIALLLTAPLRPFAPPSGGVTEPWQPLVTALFAAAIVLCAGSWPPVFKPRQDEHKGQAWEGPLVGLYSLAAPFMAAKLLTAAPWHPYGQWLLALLGMVLLLGAGFAGFASEGRATTSALAGIAVVGLGLAPGSTLAAAGAVWVMAAGVLFVLSIPVGRTAAPAALAVLPGIWLITQGALNIGYGVVAVLLMPAYLFLILSELYRGKGAKVAYGGQYKLRTTALLLPALLATLYPQLPFEWIVRPVVGAMPGGVGALSAAPSDWGLGLGLLVGTPGEAAHAALPATGIAVAVFAAWALLFQIKQLAGRFAPKPEQDPHAR